MKLGWERMKKGEDMKNSQENLTVSFKDKVKKYQGPNILWIWQHQEKYGKHLESNRKTREEMENETEKHKKTTEDCLHKMKFKSMCRSSWIKVNILKLKSKT